MRARNSSKRASSGFTLKKTLAAIACASAFVVVVFGIGPVAPNCEHCIDGGGEVMLLEQKDTYGDVKKQLDRRQDDCTSTEAISFAPASFSATHSLSDGSIAIDTQEAGQPDEETSVVSIPISTLTQTQTQTIYSLSKLPERTALTETTTLTTSIMVASESDICSAPIATVTVTYTVIPTVSPESHSLSKSWMSSSVLGDVTVTAGGSTVTYVNTEVSFTTELPDVTVTGNPSTLTNVQTDVSLTTNLPDVTVSGMPTTVTNIQTDVSMTSDLPDATVSGNPSTVTDLQTSTSLASNSAGEILTTVIITDLWSSPVPSLVTVTTVSTVKTTVTTVHPSPIIVTITTSFPEESSSSSSTSPADTTVTEFQTTTNTEPLTMTTTVWTPFPVSHTPHPPAPFSSYPAGNATLGASTPSGTATNFGAPTTSIVVVISGGTKKPDLRSRSSQLGWFMMVVAAIMFML